jgi:exodeoxyribonuclease VII small subunit
MKEVFQRPAGGKVGKEKGMRFEEALSRLEKAVKALEKGDLPLEESLKVFEEGVKLSKSCLKLLEEAERKVEILLQDRDGQKRERPFDEGEEARPES